MDKVNFCLLNPTSFEEDVFFLTYGKTGFENIENLKEHFKDSIIIFSKHSNEEFHKYVFKKELKKYFVNDYYGGLGNEFYSNDLSISKLIFEKLEIKQTLVYKNLYLINRIISDLTQNENFIWSNVQKYVPSEKTSLKNKIVVRNKFLFELFQEKYHKSCFGVKIEARNSNDYKINDFIKYLSSSHFYFSEEEEKYTKTELKWLDNLFSFVIEKNDIEKEDYDSHHFNMKLFKPIVPISEYPKPEHIRPISESNVRIICNYWEEDENNCYFIFDASYYIIFKRLLNFIDKENRFKWIDEDYFYEKFENRKYSNIKNSKWREFYLFGINIKSHDFYQRYSDFGTDNDTTIFYGDSKYAKFRSKKQLSVTHNPRGDSGNKNPGKYYSLEENLFEYFYEGNKYVLINFDDIPYGHSTYGHNVHNLENLIFRKNIMIPPYLYQDSFILTSDYLE
jgi:hypothetical protein